MIARAGLPNEVSLKMSRLAESYDIIPIILFYFCSITKKINVMLHYRIWSSYNFILPVYMVLDA